MENPDKLRHNPFSHMKYAYRIHVIRIDIATNMANVSIISNFV